MPAPKINDLAIQVARAMVITEPVSGIGWATAEDESGKALYTVAIIMGDKNCAAAEDELLALRGKLGRVDTFDGTDGEPV